MSAGWGIEVPGLLTSREVAELCVNNGVVGALMGDEFGTVSIDGPGMVTFAPAVTVGDDVLYRAQLVEWSESL
jgi:hypothetical protein